MDNGPGRAFCPACIHNEKGEYVSGNWHSGRALEFSTRAFELAVELNDAAAHAHMAAADSHEKQDHLTGRELSARAQEHPQKAHQEALMDHHHDNPGGTFGHDDIATLANQLWQARGCPPGSPDQDWFHATKQLRAHALSLKQARRI